MWLNNMVGFDFEKDNFGVMVEDGFQWGVSGFVRKR